MTTGDSNKLKLTQAKENFMMIDGSLVANMVAVGI
jgi:hypothetical protein